MSSQARPLGIYCIRAPSNSIQCAQAIWLVFVKQCWLVTTIVANFPNFGVTIDGESKILIGLQSSTSPNNTRLEVLSLPCGQPKLIEEFIYPNFTTFSAYMHMRIWALTMLLESICSGLLPPSRHLVSCWVASIIRFEKLTRLVYFKVVGCMTD